MFKRLLALAAGAAMIAAMGVSLASTAIWISDTQNYVSGNEELFFEVTGWIADSKSELGIEYVFHTGDVVSASRSEEQWRTGAEAMRILTDNSIPFLAVTGNHDIGSPASYANFLDHIACQQVLDLTRDYGATGSRYDLVTMGGRDYIFLTLSYSSRGPSQEETQWANDALAAHSDRIAIILTHSYIRQAGELTTQGRAIFENIIVKNPNVLLVLCGHARGVAMAVQGIDSDGDGEEDRSVHAVLSNYQDEQRGGNGYLRIMDFREDEIYISTYSPVLDTYEYRGGERDIHRIPLPYTKP